ncbi:MAG: aminoglycoside phosphotransferase family protein [Alphaproteobacteria bacterium]|nr:aminoglycoside phosphotransferase family protein [Alphaproteobacteria bacterium]
MSYTEDPVFGVLQKIRTDGALPQLLADTWEAWCGDAPARIRVGPSTAEYHPFERAWATVKAAVTPVAGTVVDLDLALQVFALSESAEDAADASRQKPVAPCGGPPMFTHDAWGLVGWTLPNGPHQAELRRLLRPDSLSVLLEGAGDNGVDIQRYNGPRLHRYGPSCGAFIGWRHRDDESVIVARLGNDDAALVAFANLAKVHAAAQRGELAFRAPVPLGYCRPLRTLVAAGLRGVTLTQLLQEGPPGAFVRAGGALASLHRSPLEPSRFRTAEQEKADLAQEMNGVCYALPDLAPRLTNIVDRLSVDGGATAETTAIHGNPGCDEILVEDGAIGLTNWDSLSVGDPLHDVGRLIAHIALCAGQRKISAARALECIEAVGRGYREAMEARFDAERLAWHLSVSLLLLAKVTSVQRLLADWPQHVHFAVDEAERALSGRSVFVRAATFEQPPS